MGRFFRPIGVDARYPNSPTPLWLKDPANKYWFEYLKDSRTLYVQFNQVGQTGDETFEAFFKRVMAFADANPVDRFVLDGACGAVDFGGDPIMHGFIRSDKVNQPGKLFTIIGRQRFRCSRELYKSINVVEINISSSASRLPRIRIVTETMRL